MPWGGLPTVPRSLPEIQEMKESSGRTLRALHPASVLLRDPGPVLGSAGGARPCCPRAGVLTGRPVGTSLGAEPPSPLHAHPLFSTPAVPGPLDQRSGRLAGGPTSCI